MPKKSTQKIPRLPKDLRKQAVRSIIIRNGGDFVINRIMDEVHELHPNFVKPDKHTIAADVYEVFDVVPKEILQRQKSETVKELLFTDSVMKRLLNSIDPSDKEDAIKILDAFRRYKEGKINIAEAYGLKKKVADEVKIEGGGRIPLFDNVEFLGLLKKNLKKV